MKVTRFDPTSDLIIVKARIWGPGGTTPASLAVDTGSAHTVIAAGLIDDLGYSPRQGEQIATVRTAVGKEQGYLLCISRFWALGFAISDFRVHVFDLPDGFGIDGLVGLSFLRQFNVDAACSSSATSPPRRQRRSRPRWRSISIRALDGSGRLCSAA